MNTCEHFVAGMAEDDMRAHLQWHAYKACNDFFSLFSPLEMSDREKEIRLTLLERVLLLPDGDSTVGAEDR